MSEYQPISVELAKQIADDYSKDVVVICAGDEKHDRLHFTSFGRDPIDKLAGARMAEMFAEQLGSYADSQQTTHEDFRDVPAANSRRHVELLVDAARRALPLLQAIQKRPGNRNYDPERATNIQTAIDQLQQAIAWQPKEAASE
ncbi:hypothetical protein [Blastopirellula retiformator]|uniref:Uncharacterized protein n=1 Tax=Blastopirellula retiformator TaxID=2527970 RepID=A0A5C5VLA0_9BACT|nr:hypothetical protein [Blastopirellula retiformator]TWT38700.1 hypothetical protein Enr8_03940 [Blastopirellula retiformator]